jgi:3-oxoacyl-[acyl-carrier protein] reductase
VSGAAASGPAGRITVVTGAGGGADGGIGAAIARLFAAGGARVAVNDVDAESADATVNQLRAAGGIAEAFAADISDPRHATAMIDAAAARFGGIDVVVNNAGIVGSLLLEATPDDDWRRVLDVNLSGAFFTSRAALPHLKRSAAGRIVFVSSIAGIRIGTLGGASYSASKAGMLGLMRHLAAEVARDGITANAVLPGIVLTPLVARRASPATQRELSELVPVGRAALPEEVAEAVLFLAGERAGYINGAELTVDGGRTVLPGAFAPWARAAGLIETDDENMRRAGT